MWGMERPPRPWSCAARVAVFVVCRPGLHSQGNRRTFGIAPGTVVKRLSVAMFKLGVNRQTAMIAEAMRRQIISPLCLLFMSVIVLHAVLGDESMRRERRAPESRRGGYEQKISRKGSDKVRPVAAIC